MDEKGLSMPVNQPRKATNLAVSAIPNGGAEQPFSVICEITQPPQTQPNKINNLMKWPLLSVAKDILGWKSLCECHRSPHARTVDIWRAEASKRPFYTGLDTCGSVWVCPVCASKITERRRVEMDAALAAAAALGLEVYMLTLTAPHRAWQSLGDLLEMFSKARRLMMNRKQYKAWVQLVGLVGSIRSLEVTWGYQNGWHVHTHELLFCRSKNDCVGWSHLSSTNKAQPVACPISADVLPFWKKACVSAGLDEPNEKGVDIIAGNDAIGDYVSKWGVAAEMTKSHVKKGREGHRSPWDILNDYFENGVEMDAQLFREYGLTFRGRHQLTWSKGLRDLLGLGVEKTDEEIAAEPERAEIMLASIDLPTWRKIIRSPVELRGQVLLAADAGQLHELIKLL